MNTWNEIPLDLRDKLPTEVKAAIKVFTDEEVESLYIAWSYEEPNEFIGIGFRGPGDRFTKFAELEKAIAIAIMEDQVRKEIDQRATLDPFSGEPNNMGVSYTGR